jgi:L-lactate dehydrogenase complex protein LldG
VTARDAILAAIRAADVPAAAAALVTPAIADRTDLHAAFLRVLTEVGGVGAVLAAGQSVPQLLSDMLGASGAQAVIVPGRFAVAENGAVYVDSDDVTARNAIVLAEHLVVVVPHAAIVATMHEAVRLMPAESRCGWFLSGPSKTADIEQSLVFGAQGSRTHCVIFDIATGAG